MKNLKKLMERREELKQQLAALVDAADQEERAMTCLLYTSDAADEL